jgi:CBS domain-containing protein
VITCPLCGEENIEGEDCCSACLQPLNDLSLPRPATPTEHRILKGRVSRLKPKSPLMVAPDTPVRDVLTLLVDRGVGCVVVVHDHGEVVGIFSERDALLKLNVDAAELGRRPVSEFMTRHPETVDADAHIAFAVHKMDIGGYRHLPVVDDNDRVCGVISIRDILRYVTESLAV